MPTRREMELEREKMIREVYESQLRIEKILLELLPKVTGGTSARKSSKSVKKTK